MFSLKREGNRKYNMEKLRGMVQKFALLHAEYLL